MNLHAIATRAVSVLHPNIDLILVRSLNVTNEQGRLAAQFGECEKVSAQVQTLSGDELKLEHEVYEVDIARKFFFSVTGRPVFAGAKLHVTSSDFLYQCGKGLFWRVFNVAEDFHLSGWSQVLGSLQNNPPQGVAQTLVDSGLLPDAEVKTLADLYSLTLLDEDKDISGGDGNDRTDASHTGGDNFWAY